MTWLALDIGGANLKAANAAGWAHSTPFALWKNPDGLAAALARMLTIAPEAEQLAVTMTGELCDCYRTKTEGVRHILSAVQAVASSREVFVYLTDGRLVSITNANDEPLLAAASNWRALAEFACRHVEKGDGILIDIGSTTTDVIPISAGRVAAQGRTDSERLAAGELIYAGVGRTPVCAVVRSLPWRGNLCRIASELFATTADAYLLLGDIDEDAMATWTADGRPLTREFARERLARQICADAAELTEADFVNVATHIRATQQAELGEVLNKMKSMQSATVVISGAGEFLARRAVNATLPHCVLRSLAAEFGSAASQCAAAFALAVLAPRIVD